jgi:hypothetical protein
MFHLVKQMDTAASLIHLRGTHNWIVIIRPLLSALSSRDDVHEIRGHLPALSNGLVTGIVVFASSTSNPELITSPGLEVPITLHFGLGLIGGDR